MSKPQSKSELLEKMAAGRQEWEALLLQVSDQDMKQPNVEGIWSIKEILGHICSYEQYMAATIADQRDPNAQVTAALDSYYQTHLTMARPEHPELPEQISAVRGDMVNVVFAASYRYKTPGEVRQMEKKAYQDLLDRIEATSDADISAPITETGVTLLGIIPNQCYLHYEYHIPTIRAWLEQKNTASA